jgi:KaiC/GvpD/RAD55 family RecA-like ATPase
MTNNQERDANAIVSSATGIAGLDDILCGGLTPYRLYLIEGVPGSGKTTLSLQYLLEGAALGESVLYVTLSETEEELRAMARSHGWKMDGVIIRELVPPEETLQPAEQYTMFHPAEVELSETTRTILNDVERLKPARVVFDSLSELRLLAGDPLRYRRQLLALKQFFRGRRCTVLLLDDLTSSGRDLQVQSIAHGVLLLEQLTPEYGADRRRLRVLKHRGRQFRGGYHDYLIRRGGLQVFPRLVASEHRNIHETSACKAACRRSTGFSAAASSAERARSSSGRPVPASPRSRPSWRPAARSGASARRCSSSTRACTPSSRAVMASGSRCAVTSTRAPYRSAWSIPPSSRRASSRTPSATRSRSRARAAS